MKQRPNILVQKKSNIKLDYFKHLAEENIQPNVTAPTIFAPKVKTKSKPKINVQKGIDINKVNQFRIDMLNYANREIGIKADLLIEYNTYYVLTILSYSTINGIETPTAKDFDIYCDGLKLDVNTYDVNVGASIVITIQKNEAVDDNFDTNNFEIVSKFDWYEIYNEQNDILDTETGDDIIL